MKEKYANIGIYTTMGQLTVLLAILLKQKEFQYGPPRQDCIEYISNNGWLNIAPADIPPYASTSEPRWHTALSFARENLAGAGYLDRSIKDSWAPTREGINSAVGVVRDFASGTLDVRQCFLWTPKLKLMIDPSYIPDPSHDKERPEYVYNDELPKNRKSVRGNYWDNATLEDLL